jgi:hypothetical protein
VLTCTVLPHSAQLLCRTLEGIDDLLAICSQDVRLTNFLLVYLHAIVNTLLVLATTTAAAAATAIGIKERQLGKGLPADSDRPHELPLTACTDRSIC